MRINVHKVMTTLFNVELNRFLAKFDRFKVFEKAYTGGLMEIMSHEADQFYTYVLWLKDFREQLYRKSANYLMDFEEFRKETESLLELYVHLKLLAEYHIFSEKAEKDLETYFLKPFMCFIQRLDEELESTYFVNRINELISEAVNVTVKVINAFKVPIPNVKVKFSYVSIPELKKYAKAYQLCTIKTDREGIANIRLLNPRKGGYRIDVDEYHKTIFLDMNASNHIEIKVFDFPKLIKHAIRIRRACRS